MLTADKFKRVGYTKEDKEKNAGAVKTGDSSTPILFAVIAVLSAGTIFFVRKNGIKWQIRLKLNCHQSLQ